MAGDLILVTGANGRVGSGVVKALLNRNVRPRVLVRDVTAAKRRFGDRVDVCIVDLLDADGVSRAMEGVKSVFLCSPVHPQQTRHQGHVVQAAKRNNSYVVKLSGLATFAGSYVDSGAWHAETELAIQEAGLEYTFLHPYFFVQNLVFQAKDAKQSGVIKSAVGDVAIAMVDVGDIAEVAARLLLDPRLAPGQTLPLTDCVAYTFDEVALVLTELLGQNIAYEQQTDEAVERNLRRAGQPDWHIRILLQFNRAFREGLGSRTTSAVTNILKRPPTKLKDALRLALRQVPDGGDPFPS